MDGEGSVRVPPDAARLRVGVTSEGASPTEVAQQNAGRMSAVVEALKKAAGDPALASGVVEVRTEAVTLTPVYGVDQPSPRGAPRVSGYRASNTVRVAVRELEQRGPGFLASLMEQANKAGANEISARNSWSITMRSPGSRRGSTPSRTPAPRRRPTRER
jgi:uncharacterized protein YggE